MENDILKYALENGMIDLSYVQEKIEMKKREEILEKHPYKIWKGKDGAWRTYIILDDGKRALKKRKERKDIEDSIIQHFKESEKILIETVFNEWIEQKLEYGDIQKQTYDRYKTDFTRFFSGKTILKMDIKKITENDLEKFVRKTIKEMSLTRKAYGGLRLLITGIFKYAKKKGYVDISITQFFGDMELPKKNFERSKKTDEESVFTDNEISLIKKYIDENESIINYGILLAFQTGLRVGELSTLKYSDIQGNLLMVRRTEIRYKGKDGKYIFDVRESPKTEAGRRDVILSARAKETLKKIRRMNPFGEYIFMMNGKRIKEKAFSVKIVKICRYVGIKERSMHKARKTYGTNLINGGVDESIIIKQMGHTDIECTKRYYYFNNKSADEMQRQIEKAIYY